MKPAARGVERALELARPALGAPKKFAGARRRALERAMLAGSALVFAGACERSAGRAEIVFVWESAPSELRDLYLFLRVEDAGGVLSSQPAVRLGDRGAAADLQIPSGEGRVVTADVRRGPWSNGRSLYAGATRPFDLRAGDSVELEATLRAVEGDPPIALGPAIPRRDRLRFLRHPWGAIAGEQRPRFVVEGSAGAVDPGAGVVAFDRRDVESAVVLGRSRADASGAFVCELDDVSASNAVIAFIAAADESDALSDDSGDRGLQATRVDDTRWTATMLGKVPDRDFPNPHRWVLTARANEILFPDLQISAETNAAELEAIASIDDRGLSAAHRPTWSRHFPGRSPSGRDTALAFIPTSGRALSFGGFSSAGRLADTWEWDGDTWSEVEGFGPSLRNRHNLVYHAASDRVLLFGGGSLGINAGNLGDTWTWSPDSRTWTLVQEAGGPAPRADYGVAYDSRRGEVVMFGGIDTEGLRRGDTWIWDGRTWSERVVDPSPPGRSYGALAYDSRRGVTVLYGGFGSGVINGQLDAFGDTWEWDGERWSERSDVLSPSPRIGHAITYDEARGRTVIFGGVQLQAFLDETWEWDGERWSEAAPIGRKPRPRGGGAMVYDPLRRRSLLTGGYTITDEPFDTLLDDTWEWDGERWIERTPSGLTPSARTGPAMVYDRARDEALLFGGSSATLVPLGDTWSFGQRGWMPRTDLARAPSPREAPSATADEASGAILLFGGYDGDLFLDDTWIWDGTAWFPRERATRPPARAGHRLAGDPSGGAVVFGGVSGFTPLADTWIWDGDRWAPSETSGPARRLLQGLSYDADRARTVMFGGLDGELVYADVWEWDGFAWKDHTPALSPSPRQGPALAFAPARGTSLLCTGMDLGGRDDGCWEWDGAAWTPLITAGAEPTRRLLTGNAYDTARDRWVLFGGGELGSTRVFDETWILEIPRDGRPAALMTVDWSASRAAREAIAAIELHAVAGASGGVEASMWDAVSGRWSEVAINDAPADRFGALSFRTSTAELARRFIRGTGELHVRLRPREGGPRSAIAVDAVEVTVETR